MTLSTQYLIGFLESQAERERAPSVIARDIMIACAKRLETLSKDAQRYRWISAECRSKTYLWGGRWAIVIEGRGTPHDDDAEAFDAAIDEAMGQSK